MQPGNRRRHEMIEKPRRVDVVALAAYEALGDIGRGAIEVFVKVLRHRKSVHPFPGDTACLLGDMLQRLPIGEESGQAFRQRADAGSSQGRKIDDG